ncbi:carbonic anhydrase 7-like [Leptodactylus fuscus]|uniref:carbonic anhydrase 7-like n=1 Tax=Leptodactylus fuscus TaxID=238119 RepID=UPI003F4E6FB9
MFRLVCVGVFYLILGCHASGDWCYEHAECGPSTWAEHYPFCGGYSQSPINIITSSVKYNLNLGPIDISSSAGPSTGVVTNNGHTVEVTLNSVHYLRGAGLQNPYELAAFHFHFGNPLSDIEGSEHRIDGIAYPMEVHFVFYNTKYASLEEAKTKSDGLAVVGVLFKIGERNEALDHLISVLPLVRHQGDTETFSINLGKLLSRHVENYYKYQGSLTTPPCSENVTWHVIGTPLQLSRSQYQAIVSSLYFTSKDSVEQTPMVNNFRPTQSQSLSGRTVYGYQ